MPKNYICYMVKYRYQSKALKEFFEKMRLFSPELQRAGAGLIVFFCITGLCASRWSVLF